ncbi:noroxomaritidine synthase [Brachypodium distachyon]|uniref:Cytochrome P450 n=1 Tax=Brachypodium distachyon TaxID=15368 RepID=I1I2D7_BRADI|nr:noroxomaritidine synthase [Brachypodium distachyon]KQJ95819.1 hypothetical protein BRADI_3g19220v3 [Brachypodium distachyon]|eukprot:XP_003573623.1 noroxomaritidine synthase [Brachypodium distachyon]
MAISFLQELLISTLVLSVPLYFYFKSSTRSSKNNTVLPTNWPIVGILPSLIANIHNLHGYVAHVLAASGQSFRAHGPAGTGMRFFVTCDPANVRHIFTTNQANFPKGAEFAEIFDVMRGSFFTVDGEPVRRQRAKIQTVLGGPRLLARMAASCRDKVEKALLPLFTDMARMGTPFDLQDVVARFVFDVTATPVFGVDPGLLSRIGMPMPPVDAAVAMDTVMEVALFRHTVPASCWKAMRWLRVGPERKLAAAHAVLRGFITEMMEKRIKKSREEDVQKGAAPAVDIVSSYINDPEYCEENGGGLLRATLINYMIAGRDTIGTTLPWVFYNLAKSPHAVSIIRDELSPIASRKATGADTMMIFEPEETKPLVYLTAALYESLRLYPPGPIERKTVVAGDVLPSGHEVRAGDTVFISLHAMGRMEGVWGKDCLEYNPGRWLPETGEEDGVGKAKRLRYVPSHKFLAFNSGPRMCLGKDIALMQLKTVVAAVVWNFDVEVVEGQSVEPKLSCILQIKNGLVVKLKKRQM